MSALKVHVGRAARKLIAWSEGRPRSDTAELRPLTADYRPDQHLLYVEHLSTAIRDAKVRNIALTGRYGAGKSSVLEEFSRQHQKRVLFLSLSTLGPEGPTDKSENGGIGSEYPNTNQIQKELVKQLLHRERPALLPQSRYQRIDRLPFRRAFIESALALATLGIALWLFNVFPEIPQFADEPNSTWQAVLATILTGLSLTALVAWARLTIHNRLEIAQVSAAGASVTLTKKSGTYFDQYLDEIVYFFECRPKIDVVVFEDLDRFNDAGIFEALRELNTLLNNSKQITAWSLWRRDKRTIRFVYALRDSIFEQLGRDTKELVNDAAQAEAVRANRTKFFDLVVPIVPFITHRTARELLARLLDSDGLTEVPKVSDDLVDLAAQHLPDMRLLTNIRNEYSIFAKRLISGINGVSTLTADQLFAMVVYKNLHLEDFELLQLGRSRLDSVYRLSRDLIAENMRTSRARLRKITDGIALKEELAQHAETWGERLEWFSSKVAKGTPGGSILSYSANGTGYDEDGIKSPEFWEAVIDGKTGVVVTVRSRQYAQSSPVSYGMDELSTMLGDRSHLSDWLDATEDEIQHEKQRLLADLDALNAADFKHLASRADFKLECDGVARTFVEIVAAEVPSALARKLITDGYIDRYYNLYMAQYYGERVPVKALSFIVQNVDTNRVDVNYQLNDNEIQALIKETRGSFLRDVSAYNTNLVDYLLRTNDSRAERILDNVVRHVGESERVFLDVYMAEGTHAELAARYLAGKWSQIFVELVDSDGLSNDRRIRLLDAALAAADPGVDYVLTESVIAFLQDNFRDFATVAIPGHDRNAEQDVEARSGVHGPAEAAVVNAVRVLGKAGFRCPDLTLLREPVRNLVVAAGLYTMTAANLRAAVHADGPLSLDIIREHDYDVYRDVLTRPSEYLRALEESASAADARQGTQPNSWTVTNPDEFGRLLNDMDGLESAVVVTIADRANPDAVVEDLSDVPKGTWAALAECRRFPATLKNVDVYTEYVGEIDSHLAAVLLDVVRVSVPEAGADPEGGTDPDDAMAAAKERVAERLINAGSVLPDARKRAALAGSLDLEGAFPVAKVTAEDGPLLGALIEHEVCADSEATFMHFGTADWETLCAAIKVSTNFAEFVTPALLPPLMARKLLASVDISNDIKIAVLRRFDDFVPSDDAETLSVAGRASMVTGHYLGAPKISAIARGTSDGELTTQLVHHFRESMTDDEALGAVLNAAGEYSRLSRTGENLTFPRDDYHEAVLQRFKSAGYIKSRAYAKSMFKEARIEVEVL